MGEKAASQEKSFSEKSKKFFEVAEQETPNAVGALTAGVAIPALLKKGLLLGGWGAGLGTLGLVGIGGVAAVLGYMMTRVMRKNPGSK